MAQEASKTKTTIILVLSILLGIMFVGNGVAKLAGAEQVVDNLENELNVPAWAIPIIGAIELVAAILLFVPKTRFYGAAVLTGTMIGAVFTHFIAGDFAMWVMPFVLGVGAGFIAWQPRPDDLPFIGGNRGASA